MAQRGVQKDQDGKLPAIVTSALRIAMKAYAVEALHAMFRSLFHGLHWLWPEPDKLRVT